jgi:hypothetical protein
MQSEIIGIYMPAFEQQGPGTKRETAPQPVAERRPPEVAREERENVPGLDELIDKEKVFVALDDLAHRLLNCITNQHTTDPERDAGIQKILTEAANFLRGNVEKPVAEALPQIASSSDQAALLEQLEAAEKSYDFFFCMKADIKQGTLLQELRAAKLAADRQAPSGQGPNGQGAQSQAPGTGGEWSTPYVPSETEMAREYADKLTAVRGDKSFLSLRKTFGEDSGSGLNDVRIAEELRNADGTAGTIFHSQDISQDTMRTAAEELTTKSIRNMDANLEMADSAIARAQGGDEKMSAIADKMVINRAREEFADMQKTQEHFRNVEQEDFNNLQEAPVQEQKE